MALRIDKAVARGWIDNRVRGRVTGEIHIIGMNSPIRLDLEGDCLPDMAGRLCEFTNPAPELNERLVINESQTGKTGDMTASRRCRVPDISPMEYYAMRKNGGDPPSHMSNVLYLEWFSERNGRVVVEVPDADINISFPQWKMTPEEEETRRRTNIENLRNFLDRLVDSKKPPRPAKIDWEMNEFEWELFLKESDARNEKFGELLDKFKDHPDRDEIIDEQMGWNLKADSEYSAPMGDFEFDDDDFMDIPERKEHPLVKRIGDLWLSIHRRIENTKYHHSVEPVGLLITDLVFNIQFAGTKAGSVLSDPHFENGMVIAILKRAMTGIHEALKLADNEEVREALPDVIESVKQELFAIREEMIALMNELRG